MGEQFGRANDRRGRGLPGRLRSPDGSPAADGNGRLPLAEVERHNTAGDAWVVLRGVVYDMTPYLRYHPGGLDSIASVAGTDGTATFDFYHKWVNHAAFLEKCRVGVLDPNDAAAA